MFECLNVNEVISFSRFEHSNIRTFEHFSLFISTNMVNKFDRAGRNSRIARRS